MMENKTGPTDMLSSNPNPIPFMMASTIVCTKINNLFQLKKLFREEAPLLNMARFQEPVPFFQHPAFHNTRKLMLAA
jgi:hypothetical protein